MECGFSPFLLKRLEAIRCVGGTLFALATHGKAMSLSTVANGSRGRTMGAIKARSKVKGEQYDVGKAAGEKFRDVIATHPATFYVVRLVRLSERELDDDNLASAFKAVRDGVSDALGLDDRDALVRYVVDQEKCGPLGAEIRCELYRDFTSPAFHKLPPPRVRQKKQRSKKPKPPPEGIDVKWWQRAAPAPVPNVHRPKRR